MRMPLLLAVVAATVALGAPGAMAMPASSQARADAAAAQDPPLDLRSADARDAALKAAGTAPVAAAPSAPTSSRRTPTSSAAAASVRASEDGLAWGAVVTAAAVALLAVAAVTTLARGRRTTSR